jgi:type II secretory pathway component PulF
MHELLVALKKQINTPAHTALLKQLSDLERLGKQLQQVLRKFPPAEDHLYLSDLVLAEVTDQKELVKRHLAKGNVKQAKEELEFMHTGLANILKRLSVY